MIRTLNTHTHTRARTHTDGLACAATDCRHRAQKGCECDDAFVQASGKLE
jgi:hypothetical protein